jgi:hypothetical protein
MILINIAIQFKIMTFKNILFHHIIISYMEDLKEVIDWLHFCHAPRST